LYFRSYRDKSCRFVRFLPIHRQADGKAFSSSKIARENYNSLSNVGSKWLPKTVKQY
jgi:hypothetical protein